MAYSDYNKAYGRMMRQKADGDIQDEVALANQIVAQDGCSRDEALRRASRIIEDEFAQAWRAVVRL